MGVIQLLNGQNEVVMSNNDISYIIGKYLGGEFESLVTETIIQNDANEIYAKEKLNSDLNSYEAGLESYHNIMQDTMEQLEELSEYMEDAKRINKDTIYQKINDIIRKLNKEL